MLVTFSVETQSLKLEDKQLGFGVWRSGFRAWGVGRPGLGFLEFAIRASFCIV